MKANYFIYASKNGAIAKVTINIDNVHIANQFPKSYRVYDSQCSTQNGVIPTTFIDVDLRPNKANAGINETGLKRLKNFIYRLTELYPNVAFVGWSFNPKNLPIEITNLFNK